MIGRRLLPFFAILFVTPAAALAQTDGVGVITGTVTDADTGQPIASVTIRVIGMEQISAISDAEGRFRMTRVPAGIHDLEISHVGYGRTIHPVFIQPESAIHLDLNLGFSPIQLDSLVVSVEARVNFLEQRGFYERQESGRGGGRFFQGDELDVFDPTMLVGSVPGVRSVQGSGGGFDRRVVMRRGARDCIPDIYLDGIWQRWAGGNLRDVISGLRISGIEVYRGLGPGEYTARSWPYCGVILVWSWRG